MNQKELVECYEMIPYKLPEEKDTLLFYSDLLDEIAIESHNSSAVLLVSTVT